MCLLIFLHAHLSNEKCLLFFCKSEKQQQERVPNSAASAAETSGAATHLASNLTTMSSEQHTAAISSSVDGRRVLPCRRNTQGKSLKSAAASLQKRESNSSLTNASNSGHTIGASSELTSSPTTEFEMLKELNETTVRDLNQQLDTLQLDLVLDDDAVLDDLVAADDYTNLSNDMDPEGIASGSLEDLAAGLNQLRLEGELTERKLELSHKSDIFKASVDDDNIARNCNHSSNNSKHKRCLLDFSTTPLGGSNHSTASLKTSASKEFEQLKLMHDDTVADLEAQLQILEQQEQEQLCLEESASNLQLFELSRTSLNESSSSFGEDARKCHEQDCAS